MFDGYDAYQQHACLIGVYTLLLHNLRHSPFYILFKFLVL